MKTHKFIITVKTLTTKRCAEMALLAAFAKRQPDYCEFYLKRISNKKRFK